MDPKNPLSSCLAELRLWTGYSDRKITSIAIIEYYKRLEIERSRAKPTKEKEFEHCRY